MIRAIKVGQNIIDYATGREMPADKLVVREMHNLKKDAPKRGALRIAKLKHAGDWNIAPQAIPNLMDALRKPPFSLDVVLTQKDLFPSDPNLIYYPLIYIHGRGAISFPKEDLEALQRHLEPGGGTLFADAACGSPAFDATFRKFVAELVPNGRLEPIPRDDELYSTKVGFDLSKSQYTKAAGGAQGLPAARRGQDQRPLGDHLLAIRHRLRPGAAHRDRMQGLHLRERPEDRRKHRLLFHLAVSPQRRKPPNPAGRIERTRSPIEIETLQEEPLADSRDFDHRPDMRTSNHRSCCDWRLRPPAAASTASHL